MTNTAFGTTRTVESGVLDRAADALAARASADVRLLVAAVEWAGLHPVPAGEASYAGWGQPDLHGEGVTPLAGDGAPLVAEFAPLDRRWWSTRPDPPDQPRPTVPSPPPSQDPRGVAYRRRNDGTYHWTSPTGRTFDVLPPPRRPRPPRRP